MLKKLLTSDLCGSCLNVGTVDDNSITVKDTLNSPGYNQYWGMDPGFHYTILLGLETKGGCSSCIKKVKNAI